MINDHFNCRETAAARFKNFFLAVNQINFSHNSQKDIKKKVYVFCLVILLIAELVFETIFSCSNEIKDLS